MPYYVYCNSLRHVLLPEDVVPVRGADGTQRMMVVMYVDLVQGYSFPLGHVSHVRIATTVLGIAVDGIEEARLVAAPVPSSSAPPRLPPHIRTLRTFLEHDFTNIYNVEHGTWGWDYIHDVVRSSLPSDPAERHGVLRRICQFDLIYQIPYYIWERDSAIVDEDGVWVRDGTHGARVSEVVLGEGGVDGPGAYSPRNVADFNAGGGGSPPPGVSVEMNHDRNALRVLRGSEGAWSRTDRVE
jgi:hypothetical protein